MSWTRIILVALTGVVALVGTAVVAVAVADTDGGATGRRSRAAGSTDFAVDIIGCARPQPAEDSNQPTPTRLASGTITNETGERRSFRLHIAFRTADSVRVDWTPATVDELSSGATARWEAASYREPAGADAVHCAVTGVDDVTGDVDRLDGFRPPWPSAVYSTTDNVDGPDVEGSSGSGDVGDIDAVTYYCYVLNARVPVNCGTVSN